MNEGLLSKWNVSLEESLYLFGREMITTAKLHFFRQLAPNYTKKSYA